MDVVIKIDQHGTSRQCSKRSLHKHASNSTAAPSTSITATPLVIVRPKPVVCAGINIRIQLLSIRDFVSQSSEFAVVESVHVWR